jgi:hypothetical protein
MPFEPRIPEYQLCHDDPRRALMIISELGWSPARGQGPWVFQSMKGRYGWVGLAADNEGADAIDTKGRCYRRGQGWSAVTMVVTL